MVTVRRLIVVVPVLAACGTLFDVDHDYTVGDGAASDVNPIDGSMTDSSLPDAPMDIGTPDLGTGETEAGLPCTCIPMVPAGWKITSYTAKSRPACSNGWSNPTNGIENAAAPPPTCACNCGSAPTMQPACTGSTNFTLNFSKANLCNASTGMVPANTTCTTGQWNFAPGSNGLDYLAITGAKPTPSNGTCGSVSIAKTLPSPTSDQGRSCDLTAALGSCGNGSCVATPSPPDAICIEKDGVQQCPPTFPNTHFVGASIVDTRGCTASQGCTFTNMGTCSTPSVSLWATVSCGGQPAAMELADGSCNFVAFGNAITLQSTSYTSTISGAACGFAGTCLPTGSISLANIRTICCL